MKRLITFLLIVSIFFFYSSNSNQIKASTILFSEDFSSDLSKWEGTRGNNHLWKIIDGQAEATVNSGFTITELIPKDEYWNDDWENLKVEFDFTPILGADKNFSFKFTDLNNWYEIHFNNELVELKGVTDGSTNFCENCS